MFAYKPKVEETFKLKLFEHYTYLKLPVWSWLKCKEAKEDSNYVRADVMDCEKITHADIVIPVGMIATPIGWKEVYTITASSKEKAEKCLSWFARGICVWTNHDMSSRNCGGHAFTPADNGEQAGDWRYAGKPTETVPAAECAQRFIVGYTEKYPTDNCKLDKKEKLALIAEGWTCIYHNTGGWYPGWEIYRDVIIYTPPAVPSL